MSLERRVDRLEARAAEDCRRRCERCRNWPTVRIENPQDWRAGGGPTVTGAPERCCPSCGWEPQVVVIVRETGRPEGPVHEAAGGGEG